MWTPAQLKAAYQALSPAPASYEAAAATLNAQTTTVTVSVPIMDVPAWQPAVTAGDVQTALALVP